MRCLKASYSCVCKYPSVVGLGLLSVMGLEAQESEGSRDALRIREVQDVSEAPMPQLLHQCMLNH